MKEALEFARKIAITLNTSDMIFLRDEGVVALMIMYGFPEEKLELLTPLQIVHLENKLYNAAI